MLYCCLVFNNDNMNFKRQLNSKSLNSKKEWIQTTLPETFKTENVKFNWKFNHLENPLNEFPNENEKISSGSGGSYLSNEIFYRVARLRNNTKPKLPTGHFHIAKIQGKGSNFNNNSMKDLLEIVTESLTKGINN